jgi:hypothetical protein
MSQIIGGVRVINQLHDNKYRIVWDPMLGVVSYSIYRSNAVYGTFTIITSVTSATQYFDSLPTDWNSNTVFYKVTGVDSSGGESDLTTSPAITDTDFYDYMHIPRKLNIKHYGDGKELEWLYNIVPVGNINGSNNVFYFNYNYKPGSLEVFRNRKKLNKNQFIEISSNAFSLATPTTTVTVGDLLDCNLIRW